MLEIRNFSLSVEKYFMNEHSDLLFNQSSGDLFMSEDNKFICLYANFTLIQVTLGLLHTRS